MKKSKWNKNTIFINFMVVMSAIYLLMTLVPLSIPEVFPFTISEIGGYFSGIFNPLLFLWVIIGCLYQHESLKTQQENFKSTLELTQENFKLQKEAYEKERIERFLSAQPNFIKHQITPYESINGDKRCLVQFINIGADATELRVEAIDGFCESEIVNDVKRGEVGSIKTNFPYLQKEPDFPHAIVEKLWISYKDVIGIKQIAYLHLSWLFPTDGGYRMPSAYLTMASHPDEFAYEDIGRWDANDAS